MSTSPAVVEGIVQDRADLAFGDARYLGEFPVADVAEGISLEQFVEDLVEIAWLDSLGRRVASAIRPSRGELHDIRP